jgi:hypothetical protein
VIVLKILVATGATLVATVCGLITLWMSGYISREVATATSPDGRAEAVCRGTLPESTEYEMWLRAPDQWYGTRVGPVGTETMGRCRAVLWSPGSEIVAAVNELGTLTAFDGRTAKALGTQRLTVNHGDRIISKARFESRTVVAFEHCGRLWRTTHRPSDFERCGSESTASTTIVSLEAPRGRLAAYR